MFDLHCRWFVGASLFATTFWSTSLNGLARAELPDQLPRLDVTDVSTVKKPEQLVGWYQAPLAERKGDLKVNPEGILDPQIVKVFEEVAPTVLYVTDGKTGHGTGFFIKSDGWLLTNHHVVSSMPTDPRTGVTVARIVYGTLSKDSEMQLVDGFLEAEVYRVDRLRDLALLKLRSLPKGVKTVPFVPLAKTVPKPGSTCVAIGHPSHGVLWTLRRGDLAGIGKFPQDQLGNFVRGADPVVSDRIKKLLNKTESRKVVLSTCGLNPGDSGGPLVNEEGKLIAVSFAVPRLDLKRQVDLGKFSYHVHLSEVNTFLKKWPKEPEVDPPSPFPTALHQGVVDLDGDKTPETCVFMIDENSPPTGLLIDLDQNSWSEELRKDIKEERFDPEQHWDFEFGMTMDPRPNLFFDTDNNGQVDLIIHATEQGVWRLDRQGNSWKRSKPTQPDVLIAPFDDDALNQRFAPIAKKLIKR
ncbi:MAG: trypsin-like peptidase domain-containing protein [Planctomycetaceae bacterium]|nr:trypsin-like peptidase domain-containing protein [Planctomycetaceae bacterium]